MKERIKRWRKRLGDKIQELRFGMMLGTLAGVGLFAGVTIYDNVQYKLLEALAGGCLAMSLGAVLLLLCDRILRWLDRKKVLLLFYFVLITEILAVCLANTDPERPEYGRGIAFILILAIGWLLLWGAGIAILRKKTGRMNQILAIIGAAATFVAISAIALPGYPQQQIADHARILHELQGKKEVEKQREDQNRFRDILKDGEENVAILNYGISQKEDRDALGSGTFDATAYINDYSGWKKKYRDWKLGYTLKQIPLTGVIYYPKEQKECPVMFMIHGQHNFSTKSYLGYRYLGLYLASHGYVVVSVDENALNASSLEAISGENDARALLLLENMKQVQSYTKDPQNPLYKKIDFDKICLAGHSRGGEAVAIAALFNQYERYPGNGNLRLDYHFNISSIFAIAPTYDQYRPGDHNMALKDISYFVVHGSKDQDVTDFQGMQMYDRVSFAKKRKHWKASLYVAGANHGQFNTNWGLHDQTFPYGSGWNVADFLAQEEQQEILKIYAKVFLDCTLKGEDTYQDLFYDAQSYGSYLPQTVYEQSYFQTGEEIWYDFEEDADLTTATSKDMRLQVSGALVWSEEKVQESEEEDARADHALYVKWQGHPAKVIFDIGEQDLEGATLCMDLSDISKQHAQNQEWLDAQIVLRDAQEREVTADLQQIQAIYPPLWGGQKKLQYLFKEPVYHAQLQTVRIPVEELTGKRKIDPKRITEVRLELRNITGEIYVDHVGIEKQK